MGIRLDCRKYPFGFQKLEASASGFHQVEVIYTEKMITLSNVSQRCGFRWPWATAVTHFSCGFAAPWQQNRTLLQKVDDPQVTSGRWGRNRVAETNAVWGTQRLGSYLEKKERNSLEQCVWGEVCDEKKVAIFEISCCFSHICLQGNRETRRFEISVTQELHGSWARKTKGTRGGACVYPKVFNCRWE